jgi:phosphate starvation-inducible PhoH-like protein
LKKTFFLNNHDEVISVLGEQDRNIRNLEKKYGVKIFCSYKSELDKYVIEIIGQKNKVDNAFKKIKELKTSSAIPQDLSHPESDVLYVTYTGKKIVPLSNNQKKYVSAIKEYDLVIGIGPAGTGKTFLAVASALNMLESGKVSRIVLTRPVVESGEKLGFLPGDLYEKINPYLKPLYDAFYLMLGPEKFSMYKEDETIEIIPLAYMRGRTLEDAFIILDEAQNTGPEQMKMFLTRLGLNSQIVITGDITQIDLENKNRSGLVLSEKILSGIEGIKFIHFTEHDVVRHRLVREIIKAYENWEKKENTLKKSSNREK